MPTKVSGLTPLQITAGVQPLTDSTALSTAHWTFSDKIRFVNGFPQKIGGWMHQNFIGSTMIAGTARTLYSATINARVATLIGTDKKLYSLYGNSLTNITPLGAPVAAANSIATLYGTLANNPISTVNGSSVVTVQDTAAPRLRVGDIVTLSGSSAVGGVTINGARVIRTIGASSYTFTGTQATSTATGGGAAVVRATGLINISATAHGQANGDRVAIAGATATGGITAPQINLQFIIRNAQANSFDVMTAGTATSSVTNGGGGSTTYAKEIPAGNLNESFGQGYGMGLYGVGLYGVAKTSSAGRVYPRIWFIDRFGENIVMTAGNQSGVYTWPGSTVTAPTLVPNAPAAVNYIFESDNILWTLGADGVPNRIKGSDQGDYTVWTSSATNQVYTDDIEGASRFLSHAKINAQSLLFTETQCYTFRYIGQPLIVEIKIKDPDIGIIAPMARCTANGVAYWMGQKNFYRWKGGDIEIVPANTQAEATLHDYVFKDLNTSQKSKCFAWHNKDFDEIWFHYPSKTSNECDRIARLNVQDSTWAPDTMDRTAAEYPNILLSLPRLMATNVLYRHESGTDADGVALSWQLVSNRRITGRDSGVLVCFIPDSTQNGSIAVNLKGYLYPQSAYPMENKDFGIFSTTEKIECTLNGRVFDYTIFGSEIGQSFSMGQWYEYLQQGGGN